MKKSQRPQKLLPHGLVHGRGDISLAISYGRTKIGQDHIEDEPKFSDDFKKRAMPKTAILAKVEQKPISDLPLFAKKTEEQDYLF